MAACGTSSSHDVTSSSQIDPGPTNDTAAPAMPATTIPATPVDKPTTTSLATRPSATTDEVVAISGGHLHIRCSGSGATTVVLIAGWNDDHTSFNTIDTTLTASTRVCSYDKFGTGTSDPALDPQRFSTQATDLHELLRLANEPGPYVVVGHSFGGDVAVTFASTFHDEVRGLLLLDATPTTWNSVLCAVPNDGTAFATGLAGVCAMQAETSNNAEGIEGPSAFAEMDGIASLGSLPLIVDTAADLGYSDQGASPELATQLTDAWNAGQQHWVSLSSQGELVEVPDTGHYIHIDQPGLVVEQVTSLLS